MGPTWVLSAPGGPHVGPMNLAIRAVVGKTPASFAFTTLPSIMQGLSSNWFSPQLRKSRVRLTFVLNSWGLLLLTRDNLNQHWDYTMDRKSHSNKIMGCDYLSMPQLCKLMLQSGYAWVNSQMSQITSLPIVYSKIYSVADQRKH